MYGHILPAVEDELCNIRNVPMRKEAMRHIHLESVSLFLPGTLASALFARRPLACVPASFNHRRVPA
ncbi:hypothetical protein HPB48_011648 [Haemaphysalis longicornis]|uniref:Uncharacterized protein n=1 Tax=Haemaphysalis longicornis TaxID=44386 RepID=A0A9J6FUF0_HAELO|nr:hypothetical protein HPB48_011648 [Haemaphysalis longicornis]